MPWVPKSSAPATFNLTDAFLALITGDATWGWIVDWLPFVFNVNVDTGQFCDAGPISPPDLSLIMSPGPPDRNPLAAAAKYATFAAALGLVARDRVFGAYCELHRTAGSGVFGAETCAAARTTTEGSSSHDLAFIPAGSTNVMLHITQFDIAVGSGQTVRVNYWDGSSVHILGEWDANGFGHTYGPFAVTGGGDHNVNFYVYGGGDATVTVCASFNDGSTVDHTPTSQPLPAGALSPLRTVPPTLDGVAYELELLEFKLDALLPIVQAVAGATLDLGGPLADPVALAADTPLDIGDAVGAVITATGIPTSRALDFGTPQNIVRLGHVNCGTATAWYPSVWMTHSPMVIRPFPPGTTRVTVTDLPPGTTCTIALISRNK